MSSSSYLGHGAKYWAEKYFEQQTQTRMPDDSCSTDWKSKYLALEKNCSLYQATIADLRTEVADLREKNLSKPGISKDAYWNVVDRLRDKSDKYDDVAAQLEDLKKSLDAAAYQGHNIVYWYNCAENTRIDVEALKSALQKSQDASVFNGHDAKYWGQLAHTQATTISTFQQDNQSLHQQNYNKHAAKNSFVRRHVVLIFFTLSILLFAFGLLLGEGYFVPHFTPASPYITKVQQAAESAGYDSGYSTGYDSGQRAGLWKGFYGGYGAGKRNGYNRGYNAGLRKTPDEDLRWTEEDFQALREFLSNENK